MPLWALDGAGDGPLGARPPGSSRRVHRVHPSKTDFEALLLREAARLGCRQKTKRSRINCLATHCSDVLARLGEEETLAGSTLWRDLEHDRQPSWDTLRKLVVGTGTRLVYWQLALGQITREDLAEALGQQPTAATLSDLEAEVLALLRSRPPEWVRLILDLDAAIERAGGISPAEPRPEAP